MSKKCCKSALGQPEVVHGRVEVALLQGLHVKHGLHELDVVLEKEVLVFTY